MKLGLLVNNALRHNLQSILHSPLFIYGNTLAQIKLTALQSRNAFGLRIEFPCSSSINDPLNLRECTK